MCHNCAMDIDEHHDWTDAFATWEQLSVCLQDDWVRVVDIPQRLELERDGEDDLLVVEAVRRLRARQRRALHRLGFRPVSSAGVTTWCWDVDEAVRTTNGADFSHPLLALYEQLDPAARPASYAPLRTRVVREGLISHVTQRVLQDVFGSAPADLAVVVYRELDLRGEEDGS